MLKIRTQKTAQGTILLGTGFGCFYRRYSVHTDATHTTSDGHSHGTFSLFQFCPVWLKSGHMFCRRFGLKPFFFAFDSLGCSTVLDAS